MAAKTQEGRISRRPEARARARPGLGGLAYWFLRGVGTGVSGPFTDTVATSDRSEIAQRKHNRVEALLNITTALHNITQTRRVL